MNISLRHDKSRRTLSKALLSTLCGMALVLVAACTSSAPKVAATTSGNASAGAGPSYAVPSVSVKMGIPAFADNSIYVLGIAQGWYKDVGITILPKPNGRSIVQNSDIPKLLLTNGVDVATAYQPGYLATLPTAPTIKAYNISDRFVGWALLASPKLTVKSVTELIDSGMNFKDALATALHQVHGTFAVTQNPTARTQFLSFAYQLAGIPAQSTNAQALTDPGIVQAALGGHLDFAFPGGAAQTVQLELAGWKPIMTPNDLIKYAPKDQAGAVATLVNTVGGLTTDSYISSNYDTLLRLTSVMYRIIHAVQSDPTKYLPTIVDYLNSAAGLSLDVANVENLFQKQDPLIPFEQAGAFLTDTTSPTYYKSVYSAQISNLVSAKTLPTAKYTPDDLFGPAARIYKDLVSLKSQADQLFSEIGSPKDSTAQASIAEAHKMYDAYDFLDAVGFLKAAKAAK